MTSSSVRRPNSISCLGEGGQVFDKASVRLAIEAIVRNGELDKASGEAVARGNSHILEVAESQGYLSAPQNAGRRVQNPSAVLNQFREIVKNGTDADLEELTKEWTLADCYYILREAISVYGSAE